MQKDTNLKSGDSGLRNALLALRVDYRGQGVRQVPERINGSFGRADDKVCFTVYSPSFIAHVGMQCVSNQKLLSMMPIVNYFLKNEQSVFLEGKQEGNYYLVYEVVPVDAGTAGEERSRELFAEMIKRISKCSIPTQRRERGARWKVTTGAEIQ